jgi:hypothetical protein
MKARMTLRGDRKGWSLDGKWEKRIHSYTFAIIPPYSNIESELWWALNRRDKDQCRDAHLSLKEIFKDQMQPQVIQIENRRSSLPAHFHDRRIRITWAGSYYERTFALILLLNKSHLKKALKFAWCAQLLLEDSSKPLRRVRQSIPVQR